MAFSIFAPVDKELNDLYNFIDLNLSFNEVDRILTERAKKIINGQDQGIFIRSYVTKRLFFEPIEIINISYVDNTILFAAYKSGFNKKHLKIKNMLNGFEEIFKIRQRNGEMEHYSIMNTNIDLIINIVQQKNNKEYQITFVNVKMAGIYSHLF